MIDSQLNQVTEPMQRSVVRMSDPKPFASASELFKQGLALASQIEGLIDPVPSSSAVLQPTDTLTPSIGGSEALADLTVLQPAHPADQSQPPSANVPLDAATQSWTQVWLQRGFSKLKQKNFQGACDNFKRALENNLHCVEAINGLGVAQYYLADFQGAAFAFRNAIQLNPTQSVLYCNLGAALYKVQDFVSAVSAFQKAARLDPKDVLAYYGLGVALIQQQDYSKAIAAFQRAVAININHANSYYGLGYAQYQLSELPAAIAALSKAKQRDPRYAKRYEAFLQHCLATESA
jgi:tetratricopeptide (TPR) repeat protein